MAKIAVIGLGYVGLTSLVAFAELGHSVVGIDSSSARISLLNEGRVPFFEPGLQQAFEKYCGKENFRLADDFSEIGDDVNFAFICVSTPTDFSGKTDLSYVQASLSSLIPVLSRDAVVVIKSTVPIGTCSEIQHTLLDAGIRVASNPEFLSEGHALEDFLSPSRIVIGADNEKTSREVLSLYDGIQAPNILCGLTTAESIKYASNSFLALKISFVNELAILCEATGSMFSDVALGMSLDERIGQHFLSPGPGWGGSCFPKDTLEFVSTARDLGTPMATVEAAIFSNKTTMQRVAALVKEELGELSGLKIAIWGLSFKANTDDTRESPALAIASLLAEAGAEIIAYDPLVQNIQVAFIRQASSPLMACDGASALLILTEWEEFGQVDPKLVKKTMESNPFIYDSRRTLDINKWASQFKNFRVVGQK